MGAVILRAKSDFKPRSVYFSKQLPADELEWPTPRQRPIEPTKQPIALYIIPGFLMMGAVLLPILFNANNQNPWMYLVSSVSAFSSIAMAAYYWWDYRKRQQTYRNQLRQRIEEFRDGLQQLERKAQKLAQQQRRILEDRYPSTNLLLQIVLDPKTRDKRLWARSGEDEDFLIIRLGTGEDAPSFTLQKPPTFPPEDQELNQMVQSLYQQWKRISGLPIVVPLKQVGNLVVLGRHETLEGLLYRMVFDLAVHHSPRRLRIGVIGHDLQKTARRWGWLRWLPHTRVLEDPEPPFLAFTSEEGYRLIDHVAKRLNQPENGKFLSISLPDTIVLFLDDAGLVRRSQTVQHLIEQGPQNGVYLILVGEPVPRGVRAVVRVLKDGTLSYKAELSSPAGGNNRSRVVVRRQGQAETLSATQAEEAARVMLQLEPPEPRSLLAQIPDTVPLTDLLARVYQEFHRELMMPQNEPSGTVVVKTAPSPQEVLNMETVVTLWQQFLPLLSHLTENSTTPLFRYLLRFPLGFTLKQGRLEPVMLNLLPEGSKWDGKGAYHSILIGPTGSGKSEFLKTLIWCGAYLYPPALLNVLLLDFKAGAAAEDLKVRNPDGRETYLPHLVGVVTNPGQSDATLSVRAVSRRGIYAIQLEIARRETLISRQGGAKDIWEYNEKVLAARKGDDNGVDPSLPLLPHLLIVLDEFSKAVEEFPELGDILGDLVLRGRSLGMYLLLANQLVTTPVSRLLPNVGWRIGLKLRGETLREVIHGNWPDLDRVGRGYLMCVSDGQVAPFQSAWGGVALREEVQNDHWDIYEIEPTGRSSKPLFRYKRSSARENNNAKRTDLTQGRYLTRLLVKVVEEYPEFHPNPRQVYLEPLPPELDLKPLLRDAGALAFEDGRWQEPVYRVEISLSAPIGLMDNLEEVRYDPVYVAFHQGVGHLWVLGTPTSGKDLVVTTLLLALAHRYTPDQVWFYLVESGTDLKALERLPHTGAHISLSHRERLARFLDFLKHEYEARKAYPERRVPRLGIVLHNFHRRVWGEIRDEVLFLIEQLLKNGAALGIHLILTSSSITALRDEDASALVPRLVLDMGKDEHFWDAGVSRKSFFELTRRVPGRGYWLERLGQQGREAQIARLSRAEEIMAQMDTAWAGPRPPSLLPLPQCITWDDWKQAWATHNPKTPWYTLGLPAGYDFEHRPIVAPLGHSDPLWIVVASAGRGKTNLLLLWARASKERPDPWTVWYLGAQYPPEIDVLQAPEIHFFTGENLQEGWQRLAQALQEDQKSSPHLLLLDDGDQSVALCPENAAVTIVQALQRGRLFGLWAFRTPNLSRISGSLTFDHPFKDLLLRLPVERRGFLLSHDPDFLALYNFSVRTFQDYLAQWEALKKPVRGRGLWIFRDTWRVIQIPSWHLCEEVGDEFV